MTVGAFRLEGTKIVTEESVGGLSDADAVARARDGDHEAYRVLVERYQGRAFALALRILRNDERARDAVQESLLKAYVSLDRFEGRSSFFTWLYRIVYNQCIDILRKDRSTRYVEHDDERDAGARAIEATGPGEMRRGTIPGPEQSLERSELREQISKAMGSLPDELRQTLWLREVDGLSYAEIAQILDVPKGTVMSRLHYARRTVQQRLEEAGVRIGPGQGRAGEGS